MSKNIQDLRSVLFDTIAALQDVSNPMEINRAKAIAEVAQVMINSAKVEVQFIGATNGRQGSGFFPDEVKQPQLPKPKEDAVTRWIGGKS